MPTSITFTTNDQEAFVSKSILPKFDTRTCVQPSCGETESNKSNGVPVVINEYANVVPSSWSMAHIGRTWHSGEV